MIYDFRLFPDLFYFFRNVHTTSIKDDGFWVDTSDVKVIIESFVMLAQMPAFAAHDDVAKQTKHTRLSYYYFHRIVNNGKTN